MVRQNDASKMINDLGRHLSLPQACDMLYKDTFSKAGRQRNVTVFALVSESALRMLEMISFFLDEDGEVFLHQCHEVVESQVSHSGDRFIAQISVIILP